MTTTHGDDATWRILEGDCRQQLAEVPAGSIHTCVTSPPYFGLRDYGTGSWEGGDEACDHTAQLPGPACANCGARRVDRQLGLEPTPQQFVATLVEIFREVRRALRDDGTVWLNLGDSYAGSWGAQSRDGAPAGKGTPRGDGHAGGAPEIEGLSRTQIAAHPKGQTRTGSIPRGADYKQKDLLGIPWMVAFALRADGWYLRSDIIWAKPNPMPESVTDRPTKAHEYVFLLSKRRRYFLDFDVIAGRRRSVWTVATQRHQGAHFATFPTKLIEPCILAGAPEGGVVLDPFAGAGTTGLVALRHNRSFVGVELNPAYVRLARQRIIDDAPLLNSIAETTRPRP